MMISPHTEAHLNQANASPEPGMGATKYNQAVYSKGSQSRGTHQSTAVQACMFKYFLVHEN
jgi:hypothetical protein